jgi:hypothetical protein
MMFSFITKIKSQPTLKLGLTLRKACKSIYLYHSEPNVVLQYHQKDLGEAQKPHDLYCTCTIVVCTATVRSPIPDIPIEI